MLVKLTALGTHSCLLLLFFFFTPLYFIGIHLLLLLVSFLRYGLNIVLLHLDCLHFLPIAYKRARLYYETIFMFIIQVVVLIKQVKNLYFGHVDLFVLFIVLVDLFLDI